MLWFAAALEVLFPGLKRSADAHLMWGAISTAVVMPPRSFHSLLAQGRGR